MLLENPYRHRRHHARRNPVSSSVSKLTQGVDIQEIGAAVAGVAVASLLPGYIIKTTAPTTQQKLLKLGVALGAAVAVGYLAKRFMGPSAGKAAVIGGLAGTAAQAINSFTTLKIAGPAAPFISRVSSPPVNRNIGRTYEPEFQKVGTV